MRSDHPDDLKLWELAEWLVDEAYELSDEFYDKDVERALDEFLDVIGLIAIISRRFNGPDELFYTHLDKAMTLWVQKQMRRGRSPVELDVLEQVVKDLLAKQSFLRRDEW
jgi:NTP pyrophosphatase (non-canonical NTP hydrolase)